MLIYLYYCRMNCKNVLSYTTTGYFDYKYPSQVIFANVGPLYYILRYFDKTFLYLLRSNPSTMTIDVMNRQQSNVSQRPIN